MKLGIQSCIRTLRPGACPPHPAVFQHYIRALLLLIASMWFSKCSNAQECKQFYSPFCSQYASAWFVPFALSQMNKFFTCRVTFKIKPNNFLFLKMPKMVRDHVQTWSYGSAVFFFFFLLNDCGLNTYGLI